MCKRGFHEILYIKPTLGKVEAVEVVGAEGRVALRTLATSGVVPGLQTLHTKDVEALGQHRVLPLHLARRTRQRLLQ